MDDAVYAAEAEVEEHHWWFVGRRRLFGRVLQRAAVTPTAQVLDIGTSTGTNLRMLRTLGFDHVGGVDISEAALRFCASKGHRNVRLGSVLDLPYREGEFDVALATDIIEHVDDDATALGELRRVLRPGGLALITVPAFPILWGPQDIVAHHVRRYRADQLRTALERAGFEVADLFHFNYLLFLPILLARKLLMALRLRVRSENDINFGLMNRVLSRVFAFDVATAPRLHPPFGVSILALARRP